MKYDYIIIELQRESELLKKLDEAGAHGFRFVAQTRGGSIIMEREKK